jgi:signal transduction histidine kinase
MDIGPPQTGVWPNLSPGRLRARLHGRTLPLLTRLAVDWAPPVALAVAAAHELGYDQLGVGDWILAQGLAWPLLLRRRFPVGVLCATMVIALLCWAKHDLFASYLSVLFALHAVAAQRPRGWTAAAALVVEAGVVLVSWRFAPSESVNDAVTLLTALVLTFLLLGTTQHVQRQYLVVLEERAVQLERERDQQAQLSAAEERARIARELHDIVAHSVSVMVALSEGAAVRTRTNTAHAEDAMRQVAATGRQALAELRTVVSVLRDAEEQDREPQPTLSGLTRLADDVTRTGLPVSLTMTGPVDQVPEAVQLSVYRIVQEALTNVLKHADRPTRAQVTVDASRAEVRVRVLDDGRRRRVTVPGDVSAPSGNGIRGMCERAELFGGRLTAGWKADGWQVIGTLDPAVGRP